MRAVAIAGFAGLIICAAGQAPAQALPALAGIITAAPDAALRFLLPAGHHGHHGHWRHGNGRWSRYAPAPETNEAEAPIPAYVPPAAYAPAPGYAPAARAVQPVAPAPAQSALNRGSEAQAQTMPGRGAEAAAAAPSSGPSIQWVNPDHAAR
jgi:hypothetical protein